MPRVSRAIPAKKLARSSLRLSNMRGKCPWCHKEFVLSEAEAARFQLFYFVARHGFACPLPTAICDRCWQEMKENRKPISRIILDSNN